MDEEPKSPWNPIKALYNTNKNPNSLNPVIQRVRVLFTLYTFVYMVISLAIEDPQDFLVMF